MDSVVGPYKGPAISDDGHSALVVFELPGDTEETSTRPSRDRWPDRGRRRKAHPDFRVEQIGAGSTEARQEIRDEEMAKSTFCRCRSP